MPGRAASLRNRHDVLPEPVCELLATQLAKGNCKDNSLLFVNGRVDFVAPFRIRKTSIAAWPMRCRLTVGIPGIRHRGLSSLELGATRYRPVRSK